MTRLTPEERFLALLARVELSEHDKLLFRHAACDIKDAARREAYEKAAKVAEEYHKQGAVEATSAEFHYGNCIAAAIRRLAEGE